MPNIGDIKYTKRKTGKPQHCDRSIWNLCPLCGKGRWSQYYRWKRHPDTPCFPCAQKLAGKKRIGLMTREKHPRWTGGRHTDKYGYVDILLEKHHPYYCMTNSYGYIREHRLVVAQHLNRPLEKNEIVHHLNGIKDDNRFENLGVVSLNSHQHNTIVSLLKKRIRVLEAQLSQLRMTLN